MKFVFNVIRTLIFKIPFLNMLLIKKDNVISVNSKIKKTKISIIGKDNIINVEDGCHVANSSFYICGSNNKIVIKKGAFCNGVEFYIEDDGGEITVGSNTVLNAKSHFAVIEGSKIKIGSNCLFSSNIVFRTGDSHSVLDMNRKRINPTKDIEIADNVWIGYDVKINKGVKVSENSIVGTGSILTKQFDEQNVMIAGVPAKIIKHNVNWCAERIPTTDA